MKVQVILQSRELEVPIPTNWVVLVSGRKHSPLPGSQSPGLNPSKNGRRTAAFSSGHRLGANRVPPLVLSRRMRMDHDRVLSTRMCGTHFTRVESQFKKLKKIMHFKHFYATMGCWTTSPFQSDRHACTPTNECSPVWLVR